MNTRAFTLALIIAVFSMFMVYTYIEDEKGKIVRKYGTEQSVVIAKVNIKELELIDDSKVQVISVPKKFVAPKVFVRVSDVDNTIATVPILKGEQITAPRLTYGGASTGLSRQVSVGKRAIAIAINDAHAVSKLLKPGDRVDVLAGIDYAGGRKDLQKTKTILQDVLVLSTGMSVSNNIPLVGVKTSKAVRAMKLNTYTKYNTVTLELDPYQVQKLVYLISYMGQRPFLALRNNQDKDIVRIKSTRIYDILGEDKSEAKAFFDEKYKRQ